MTLHYGSAKRRIRWVQHSGSYNPPPAPVFTQDFVTGGGGALPPGSTFSRGTTGTYYNQSGLITTNENLLTYSVWPGSGGAGTYPSFWSVTGNSILAVSCAQEVVQGVSTGVVYYRRLNGSSGYEGLQPTTPITYPAGTQVTASIFVRIPAGVTATALSYYDGVNMPQIATAATLAAQPVGTWVRYSVTLTAASAGTYGGAFISAVPIGVGTGFDLAMPQVQYGGNVSQYNPTTSAAVYGPRFDYDPITLQPRGLLIEGTRTNSALYSQDFTNAAWIKVASTFGTSGTAPDGTATMALVNATIAVPSWIYQVVTVTASTTYTVSYYVKQGTSSAQLIRIFDGTLATIIAAATVSWSSGVPTLNTITGYASTSIAPVGNGIYRFTGTFSSGAYTSIGALFHPDPNNTGLNTYVWGAQLEAGAFATSYIPTTSATVTRNFDNLGITAISSWYNTAQGTVLAAFDTNYLIGAIRIIGTQTAATPLSINGGGAISIYDGTNVTTSNLILTNTVAKAASTYVGSSFTICLNGATPTSGAGAGTYPFSGVTAIYFGCQAGNQNFLNGHLRSFSYYNYALTNAQLQQVTTLDSSGFNVLPSAGSSSYPVTYAVLSSGGTSYTVVSTVLGSSGTSYTPI